MTVLIIVILVIAAVFFFLKNKKGKRVKNKRSRTSDEKNWKKGSNPD